MKDLAQDNDFMADFLDILEDEDLLDDDMSGFDPSEENYFFKDRKKKGYPAS
tara:strand:+ start:435 stop:590 length:156 start_codon:yes stop_codon:yes gene_type:complete